MRRAATIALNKKAAYLPLALLLLASLPCALQAYPNIRSAFFDVYPDAVGTVLDTVPSNSNHCGVCHFDFNGGGPRNLYGQRLAAVLPNFSGNPAGRRQAIQSIATEDPDNDGYATNVEVTDLTSYINTPTFPGLNPANVGLVSGVDTADIEDHLVPSAGADTTPPDVLLTTPNGGETATGNQPMTVFWTATDASGIAAVDLLLSYDNGGTFEYAAKSLANTGKFTWFAPNRPTAAAIFRVVATDNALNTSFDDSDAVFSIVSPGGGIVPTTLRDFDQPGTQPFEGGEINAPLVCSYCHGNYDRQVEPYYNWQGSMMAHAGRDLIMEATMVIANQDAPDSGDLCLRCHMPAGWLQGRSVPTDGSRMTLDDREGVSCDICHRLVDPIYNDGVSPTQDLAILAALSTAPVNVAGGMYVIDYTGTRRGPFVDATSGHAIIVSPFHQEAALCGTCHDVNNTAFHKAANGAYVPNAFDEPADSFTADQLGVVERTYSEWLNSAYNSPQGIYAPQFGGNKDYVATCQDCHMRDVTGVGCNLGAVPVRPDLPLHDITGGSTWYPSLLPTLYPDEVNAGAIADGIIRARYMLQNAATLAVQQDGPQLKVTVTNETGHKLPTGYPEGRRMWINVRFLDAGGALVSESAAYDAGTGVLTQDAQAMIYETKPGLDETLAPLVGVAPGPSFHFVLNNKVFKDNRIPPRGFTNAAFEIFGGAPVGRTYADGQYWDDAYYTIPAGAVTAEVSLNYQSISKEFVEFLRDHNTTNTKGQELYDLWNNNGKCPPEVMAAASLAVTPPTPGDCDFDGDIDSDDWPLFAACVAGPAQPLDIACSCADFDSDADVDLKDMAVYTRQPLAK